MAHMTFLEMAVVEWYDNCYLPLLPEEPTAVHWAIKTLADKAREIKDREGE